MLVMMLTPTWSTVHHPSAAVRACRRLASSYILTILLSLLACGQPLPTCFLLPTLPCLPLPPLLAVNLFFDEEGTFSDDAFESVVREFVKEYEGGAGKKTN